jgi:hypothetical protein
MTNKLLDKLAYRLAFAVRTTSSRSSIGWTCWAECRQLTVSDRREDFVARCRVSRLLAIRRGWHHRMADPATDTCRTSNSRVFRRVEVYKEPVLCDPAFQRSKAQHSLFYAGCSIAVILVGPLYRSEWLSERGCGMRICLFFDDLFGWHGGSEEAGLIYGCLSLSREPTDEIVVVSKRGRDSVFWRAGRAMLAGQ